jgi:hypothetical protein
MKLCVVTPYFQPDPLWLRQAHESVRQQTVPAQHVLVSDGGPPEEIPGFGGSHIILHRNYRDHGNTPRLIGCAHAMAQGADAIAFLDADNWYQAPHLADMLEFVRENSLDAACSARYLHRLDGTLIGRCPIVNANPYIDTNCLLVMRSAFQHLITWTMLGQHAAIVANQAVWQQMQAAHARLGFLDRPSVCYRTRHATHYRMAGENPPPEAFDRASNDGDGYMPPHTVFSRTEPA